MPELCDIVTEENIVVGHRARSDCHGNPELIHRAVHILVFNSDWQLLLQKRSLSKEVQPGRWDSSVGGHVEAGENYLAAARREMKEELGLSELPLTLLYPSKIRNSFESENVMTFLARYDGAVDFSAEEIAEVRYWTPEEIDQVIGKEILTPNFEEEWGRWQIWHRRYLGPLDKPVAFCSGDIFPDLFHEIHAGDCCARLKT